MDLNVEGIFTFFFSFFNVDFAGDYLVAYKKSFNARKKYLKYLPTYIILMSILCFLFAKSLPCVNLETINHSLRKISTFELYLLI